MWADPLWSITRNGTHTTNPQDRMFTFWRTSTRLRIRQIPKRRWEIIPSSGRMSTTRRATSTFSWGTTPSYSKIRLLRQSSAMRSFGRPANEDPLDFSLDGAGRSLHHCDQRRPTNSLQGACFLFNERRSRSRAVRRGGGGILCHPRHQRKLYI